MSVRTERLIAPAECYEDELPADITDEEYAEWFKHSRVDGVRIGPRPPERLHDMHGSDYMKAWGCPLCGNDEPHSHQFP